MSNRVTPGQLKILAHADDYNEGKITWVPGNVKGADRQRVIDRLRNQNLIKSIGNDWFISDEGYKALEFPLRAMARVKPIQIITEQAKPRTRENSKQAQVIAMLKRPEGTTISQICEATGWQPHTVRGTFAGAFKKKLDLSIVSDKAPGGERVYRID